MANEKILNTRIKLKYDLYSNWSTNNPVLLEGEVALAYVPTADPNHNVSVGEGSVTGTTPPQVLIKVGDGTNHYNDLKYVSALAADVLAVCKSETALIAFINNLITGANLASNADLEALAAQVNKLNGKDTEEGSVAKAIKDAIDALNLDTTYAVKEHKHTVSDITNFDEKVKEYDYATKTEAQGYANAKDQAIATAKKAGDDAQADINAMTNDGADLQTLSGYGRSILQYVTDSIQNNVQPLENRVGDNETAIAALQTAQAGGLVRSIVTELPAIADASDNTVYMIKREAGLNDKDIYDEYILVEVKVEVEGEVQNQKQFELLGNTELDLSNYYDKGYIDAIDTRVTNNSTEIDNIISGATTVAYAQNATCDYAGNQIDSTYETKDSASAKLEEAKGYTDALANGQVKTNKEAIEAINHAETGILAQAKADSADKAAVVLSEAQKYADGLATNYATAEQGQKADSALQEVVANDLTDKPSGIKVTEKNKIEVDDTIVWVFDCGDSTVE